jgi:hypothetical protein
MKHKCCYDIIPKSAKVVIFDTQLLVILDFACFNNEFIIFLFLG